MEMKRKLSKKPLFEPKFIATNQSDESSLSTINVTKSENFIAMELFKELREAIDKFSTYKDIAWTNDNAPELDDSSNASETDTLAYEKAQNKYKQDMKHQIDQCFSYYKRLKDDIFSCAFKISMKTISESFKLLDEMYCDLFSKNKDYDITPPDQGNASFWASILDYDETNKYTDWTVSYYQKLCEAFSEYPRAK